jgi:hypothetical protein
VVGGVVATQHAADVEAGSTSGTLTFTPDVPRPGQMVEVSYRPAAALSGKPWLALRARFRRPSDDSYNTGIPTATAGVLRRDSDGNFTGHFTLPDSVVYAAFVVEDSSASDMDDNASRDWELLVHNAAGKPRFEALDERAKDMMGRNWEEGLATAERMTKVYPHDLRAWIWLVSFDSWLGRADDDSVHHRELATLAAFDATFSSGAAPSHQDIAEMAWYAYRIDSTASALWRSRLLREAPDNSYAVQWRLLGVLDSLRTQHDTIHAFRRLDALWTSAPRDRQRQIANYATSIALDAADTTRITLWTTRLVDGERDPRATARWVATRFASVPALRAEGIQRLRAELDSLSDLTPSDRALDETLAQQRDRHAASRRRLLATLGQAYVAAGNYAAAREPLAEAAASGWNLDVFRAVRAASLAAGDTARALTMEARVAVDPRTTPAFADSVRPAAERVLGAAGWHSALDSARVQFVTRMLATASPRSLHGDARLLDLDGREHSLKGLTDGHVAVIAFWSRFCGPAIENLPDMDAMAAHLGRTGVRVVSIVDEAIPSAALKAFLLEKHVTTPTYLDAWHEAGRAFNQWGTPDYYVVDSDGRIRFSSTNSADEALARAEALWLSEDPAIRTPLR